MDRFEAGAIFTTVVVVAAFVIAVVAVNKDSYDRATTPQYKIGQCIVHTGDYEPWDVPQIWRIEMVGKRSYLVRKTPINIYQPTPGTVISFLDAHAYKQVDCPPKS